MTPETLSETREQDRHRSSDPPGVLGNFHWEQCQRSSVLQAMAVVWGGSLPLLRIMACGQQLDDFHEITDCMVSNSKQNLFDLKNGCLERTWPAAFQICVLLANLKSILIEDQSNMRCSSTMPDQICGR